MRALERALQRLRPLVEANKTWDYCVVWKLGDDPSRYIEWSGCCCAGAYGDPVSVKEVKTEEPQLPPLCRDTYIEHPAKTKTCGALADFPSSIPLYSGIHGEAVISTEPRWLSSTKDSNSNQSHVESTGTQVLIPVVGGLIELFTAKHIPKDQKTIDFVIAQYNMALEQEAISAQSYSSMSLIDVQPQDPSPGECLNNWPAPLHYINFFPRIHFLPPLSQPGAYPSFEGSSTASNPSNQYPSLNSGSGHLSPNVSVNESIEKTTTYKKPNSNRYLPSNQEFGLLLGGENHSVEKENLKSRQRIGKEPFQSKNLVTERNRRNRIKDGLFNLRALVPKISKMNKAAILGDAIEYIEELQKKVKKLQDELSEMAEEECNMKNDGLESPELNAHKGTDEEKPMEVQVEVNQIGKRDFLLKFLSQQKQGGVMRLMEAMDSLGLRVIDANITTFNGKVLNILRVEVNKMEVQPKSLKDSLIKLINKKDISTVDRGDSMKRRSGQSILN